MFTKGAVAKNEQPSKQALEEEYFPSSFRAAPRDAFPVLFNPPMGGVNDGDRILQPNEWVIGIALKGEAKAYPVDVMGFHELINDVVGGTPITVRLLITAKLSQIDLFDKRGVRLSPL